MKIYALAPNTSSNKNKTTFKSNQTEILNEAGNLLRRTDSCLARYDFDSEGIKQHIIKKMSDLKPKFLFSSCADGGEAYTMAITMGEHLNSPIIASDIDPNCIERGQKGLISLTKRDLAKIEARTRRPYTDYFTLQGDFQYINGLEVAEAKATNALRDKVKFVHAHVLDTLQNEHKEPVVFSFRNAWPYLQDKERQQLVQGIATLPERSLYLFGDYDNKFPHIHNVRDLLNSGYKQSTIGNCYIKEHSTIMPANPEFYMKQFAKITKN